ncbi:hypothetical protein NW762_002109 [Fusarium torreyae]|uniref:JmjC domain-containing protein n=1 Tax=Fusarium torreyae TaxID=1237075 RepID=A0A9W8SFK5_9HYPO|nr:hypothetical protein NW762_002109 [Fusarium torreyae]
MASTAHEQILVRYLNAAQELTEGSKSKHSGPLEALYTREKLQDGQKDSSPDDKDESQSGAKDIGPTAVAMIQLLARQAHVLITIHKHLTSNENTEKFNEDLLRRRIADLISISSSKFYAYRYDLLPPIWRQIYTDACILDSFRLVLRPLITTQSFPEHILDVVVEKLDRALITAGGGGRQQWLEETLRLLEEAWADSEQHERPAKRRRQDGSLSQNFSSHEPHGRPGLSPGKECPRYSGWTMPQFEDYMNSNGGEPRPIVFTDLIADWPALTDHPWKSPDYLLSKTFGGRRLIPIEIGRSYVDEGWGQELIQFREFLARYVEGDSSSMGNTGYLAQHNLFQQIPSLRNDICIPNLCWVDVPPHPTTPSMNQPTVDMPQLNAWFGPPRTITPLHTDGYHNLLCQAVGTKYLRLYPPRATPAMRPRAPEHGVDMSNTSGLDVGVLEGWDEMPGDMDEEDMKKMKDELDGVEYWECILGPGDTLVIPIGWWHYVRSLSVSFSVSFWWNS